MGAVICMSTSCKVTWITKKAEFISENTCLIQDTRIYSEWPSGPASSISLSEVKHGCVRPETEWVTFQMNDQNSLLRRSSEGTLN